MEHNVRFILTLSCPDTIGIVARVTAFLFTQKGFILELSQYGDEQSGHFFMRAVFYMHEDTTAEQLSDQFQPIAAVFNMEFSFMDKRTKPNLMIMVSKQGHCLNDLLHRYKTNHLHCKIPLVVSNHETHRDLVEWYNIPFYHLPVTDTTRPEQEAKILSLIEEHDINLVALARYMQVLSENFVKETLGKCINIHHSFLPSFKGARPYHQAYEKGVKIIGATAHYVTEDLDEGPIIEQEITHVNHTHTVEKFIALGGDIECRVLARAVSAHLEQRILCNGNKTIVFKQSL